MKGMRIYTKCKSIGKRIRQQGLWRIVHYYRNRKEEAERAEQIIRNYHILKPSELQRQREMKWDKEPLISIITPLYNTPEEFLKQMIESVQKQTYKNWELCLADGSDEEHAFVEKICSAYAKQDSRIIYRKLKENEGIVGNTNRCIELASGDYIGLLDHDDLLHPSALYEVVKKIEANADFLYTDEMKFQDSVETATDIICKNGFAKDELRSHNYICHFVVFKTGLLNGMKELYRAGCEGSQDYDMVLRLTERAKKIVHIPKVLYYWRVHPGSVSMNLSGKQYAVDAAKRAIEDQLKRNGETGKVESNLPYETIYRIYYNIEQKPLVSVILSGKKEEQRVKKYIKKFLEKTDYRPLEIVCTQLEGLSEEWEGVSFSTKASGKYFVFIEDDCLPITETWIEELLMFAQREDVGCVGPWILYKNRTTCFAGAVLDRQESSGIHIINYGLADNEQGYEANMRHVRNTSILTSRCMMVNREVFESLGGFDDRMKEHKDADFCLRSQKSGYWNVWTCFAKVECKKQSKDDLVWKKSELFDEKWGKELLELDRYYHPLLKMLKWM